MQAHPPPKQAAPHLWHYGEGRELLGIYIAILLRKLVTLNLYHFWAKTRIRSYLWSNLSYDGDRFEYTGRGWDLFLGFVKVALALIVLVAAVAGLSVLLEKSPSPPSVTIGFIPNLALAIIFFFFVGVASYSARRYLLSRTRWRSIRFAQTGSALAYAAKWFGHGLLVLLTLGLYWPFRRHRLLGYKINNTWFGSARFSYNGKGRDLFGRFLLSYLLTLPTLGLIWFWYLAREARYVAAHTRLQKMRFDVDYTGGQLLWLRLSNYLLLLITFGLAYPWVLLRNLRFLTAHLLCRGQIDYAAILQSQEEAPKTGEGLAEMFGVSGNLLGLGRI